MKYEGFTSSQLVLYVSLQWGNDRSSFDPLWDCLCFMEWTVYDFLDSLGFARQGSIPALLFEWRNWFEKHSSNVWNFVPACVMWWDLLINWLGLDMAFYQLYFDFWFSTFSQVFRLICLYFFKVLYVHHREHRVVLFIFNKILLLIRKGKKEIKA